MTDEDFSKARQWLADAPLFIDAKQVERFFDAVVRPAEKLKEWTYMAKKEEAEKTISKFEATLKAAGGHAFELWMQLKGEFGASLQVERGSGKGDSLSKVYNPIYTPQRQLIALAEYYQEKLKTRNFYVTDPGAAGWRDSATIAEVPRELVFLDLPGQFAGGAQTKLIPIAAEFANGKIVPFFVNLRAKNGENPPAKYPESQEIAALAQLQDERRQYWQWFIDNFQVQASIQAIEAGAELNGRIRWIDFRLPINQAGDTLHLHFSPASEFDTGVFAYNLIRRGFEFGLRIVGTMKSDPDMDVLAVYDK